MNNIVLTNLGGFPFEQDTLKFMQDAYGDLFKAMARLAGEKTILSGVELVGSSVSDGWISYGGEILPFVGGAAGDGVLLYETAPDTLFEDGTTKQVYKSRFATIGTPGAFPFTDLVRVDTLASLWALVKRPVAYVSYKGSQLLGDVGGSFGNGTSLITVSIPDQGSDDYVIGGSLVGLSVAPNSDNNVSWIITNKTAASFQISLRESGNSTQNLRFDFTIIKSA